MWLLNRLTPSFKTIADYLASMDVPDRTEAGSAGNGVDVAAAQAREG